MAHHPILVTGSTRSGTTWVGRMLCASGEAGYLNEPFNPIYHPGWVADPLPSWHLYVTSENEAGYREIFDRVVRLRYPIAGNLRYVRDTRLAARFVRDAGRSVLYRWRGVRPLFKDPFAVFSAPWLEERYATQIVVMVRHPAGVISSVKRLGWGRGLGAWTRQPLLMRELLAPYADGIEALARDPDGMDAVDRGILVWNAIYSVVRRYRDEHPGWRFVRYEDAAGSPAETFRMLYGWLGLRWDDGVGDRIRSYSDASNPAGTDASDPHRIKLNSRAASGTWHQRLTAGEIERIREGTRDLWPAFYSPADWDAPDGEPPGPAASAGAPAG